jgi:hypothetical protein
MIYKKEFGYSNDFGFIRQEEDLYTELYFEDYAKNATFKAVFPNIEFFSSFRESNNVAHPSLNFCGNGCGFFKLQNSNKYFQSLKNFMILNGGVSSFYHYVVICENEILDIISSHEPKFEWLEG